MSREKYFLIPSDFIRSKGIYMLENTGCAGIPESVVEFGFFTEFIGSMKRRKKKSFHLLFWCIDRVHIDTVFSIIGTELYEIILIDNIDYLELIHKSWDHIERFTFLFSGSAETVTKTPPESKWEHELVWPIHLGKWLYDIIYRFDFVDIIISIVVTRCIITCRTIGKIPHIIHMHEIPRETYICELFLIYRPVSIEWWLLWEPPTKSDSEYCEKCYEKHTLKYKPENLDENESESINEN